ncbi:MAG: potassium-transporting ATPase subunit KdpC [Chlorobiaceae bacterium]|nr:potassium-transporting ATPase subunit KdpC [Chlorobiaceae bacterium]NTV61193.1 potassium-transporting ATPase subunit KdpC [Chlorobiaceae bacterium]
MNEISTSRKTAIIEHLAASLRILAVTMIICSGAYTLMLYLAGRMFFPAEASGSLVTANGTIAGSRLVAQKFSQPGYFWPRPSAVDYNAAAAGGSNLSPASAALRKRAMETLSTFGATSNKPVPADLIAASGSGLDPHITLEAARFQAPRVARARNLPVEKIKAVIEAQSSPNTIFSGSSRLVNVLGLNIALDQSCR